MTRDDFQKLADIRAREAGVLLAAKCYDGAYYRAGYAVECALKACIAKLMRRHDFPPSRATIDGCYTHDLARLVKTAELGTHLQTARQNDRQFSINWAIAEAWSEQSRYQRKSKQDVISLLEAVTDPSHGILPWLKTLW